MVGGEEVSDSVRAGVGRPLAGPCVAVGVLVPSAVFGPSLAGAGLEVARPELGEAEDDFRLVFLEYDLTVGDRVKMLDPGLLGRVVGVA